MGELMMAVHEQNQNAAACPLLQSGATLSVRLVCTGQVAAELAQKTWLTWRSNESPHKADSRGQSGHSNFASALEHSQKAGG
jgi:hypothetical protein